MGQVFDFTVHQQRESRSLHATGRPSRALTPGLHSAGEGSSGVDTDQPVSLRATHGGVGETVEFVAVFQVTKTRFDSVRGHRLEPEASHLSRLGGVLKFVKIPQDLSKDEFAFAAGVASVDHFGDVVTGIQLLQYFQSLGLT